MGLNIYLPPLCGGGGFVPIPTGKEIILVGIENLFVLRVGFFEIKLAWRLRFSSDLQSKFELP